MPSDGIRPLSIQRLFQYWQASPQENPEGRSVEIALGKRCPFRSRSLVQIFFPYRLFFLVGQRDEPFPCAGLFFLFACAFFPIAFHGLVRLPFRGVLPCLFRRLLGLRDGKLFVPSLADRGRVELSVVDGDSPRLLLRAVLVRALDAQSDFRLRPDAEIFFLQYRIHRDLGKTKRAFVFHARKRHARLFFMFDAEVQPDDFPAFPAEFREYDDVRNRAFVDSLHRFGYHADVEFLELWVFSWLYAHVFPELRESHIRRSRYADIILAKLVDNGFVLPGEMVEYFPIQKRKHRLRHVQSAHHVFEKRREFEADIRIADAPFRDESGPVFFPFPVLVEHVERKGFVF